MFQKTATSKCPPNPPPPSANVLPRTTPRVRVRGRRLLVPALDRRVRLGHLLLPLEPPQALPDEEENQPKADVDQDHGLVRPVQVHPNGHLVLGAVRRAVPVPVPYVARIVARHVSPISPAENEFTEAEK